MEIKEMDIEIEDIQEEDKKKVDNNKGIRAMIIKSHKERHNKEPTEEEIEFAYGIIEDSLKKKSLALPHKIKNFEEKFYKNYKELTGDEGTEEQCKRFKALWYSREPVSIFTFIEDEKC